VLKELLGNLVLIFGGLLMLSLANVFANPLVRLAFAFGGVLLFVMGIKEFTTMIRKFI
jgi:hypothetical protein